MSFTGSRDGDSFGIGSQVAGYRIVEEIGRGGMAVVYRAHDVRLDRWVALKILSSDSTRNRAFRQRFIRESRAAAAVDHPNILPIFEAGETDGIYYIAMRYVSDGDVRSLLDRVGPLPVERAVGITIQVAAALDAAHARDLVHRDVKPANILIGGVADHNDSDHVYLSDFGISLLAGVTTAEGRSHGDRAAPAGLGAGAGPEAGLTVTDELVGTVHYASPEQILGLPLDGRADAYSLACAFFEMLAGQPPFDGGYDKFGRLAQFSAFRPELTRWRPDLPPAVDEVLDRALAARPDDRYTGCRELADALAQACGVGAGQLPEDPAATDPAAADPTATASTATALAATASAAQDAPGPPGQPGLPGQPGRPVKTPGPGRRRGLVAAAGLLVIAAGVGSWALLHGNGSPQSARAGGTLVRATSDPAGRPDGATASTTATATARPTPTATREAAARPTASAGSTTAATPSPSAASTASATAASRQAAADCTTSATADISADCYTASNGAITVTTTTDPAPAGVDGNQLPELADGDYLEYPDVNFGSGANHFTARVASGAPAGASGGVEVVLDNPDNTPVAGFSLGSTGGWNTWETTGSTMTEVTGIHNVYIVLSSGGSAPYLSLHYFTFTLP